MQQLRSAALIGLIACGCWGGGEADEVTPSVAYPKPQNCALPPEDIRCEGRECSALYVCDHSERVRIDAFTWCDLGQPEGFVCYWPRDCLAEAKHFGIWPEGCSDADPPGPHSPLGLAGAPAD